MTYRITAVARPYLTVALIVAGLWVEGSGQPAWAEVDAAQNARNRISLAARQRMLSQRMAKSACLSMVSVDSEVEARRAHEAATSFDAMLVSLADGDAEQGVLKETYPDVRAGLARTAALSSGLTASARQIAAGDLHTVVVWLMVSRNLPTLSEMHATMELMEAHYGTAQIDPGIAAAIVLAGRQGMLSQKMVKELCFLSIGIGGADVREALADTVGVFDTALHRLFRGGKDGALGGKPKPRQRGQLRAVKKSWKPMKQMLEEVVAGGEITDEILLDAARQSEVLLQEADALVLLYTQD
ncbi:type IV pili methyl-accepting chemotaxis transducer N-terminal domain-containing protein [Sulfitobacter sp. EhC04]|uniref:type IV pili methyl-accepting chemotaxis transducer N-terminal domain-containing protein n=1 Tax=Sulfitobacter sp. EhC04 TaxID=1849168 RepID=UPI0009EE55C3|nr:type IV pili methyl-accepting chemotaxis transducer N-terminal domain-containing protein [Sulfitobacter sp. EhC04]